MCFNEIKNNNITYSIDKIRLKTYITSFEFSKIEYRFQTIWSKYVHKKYSSYKCQLFKYNYNIRISDNQGFYFGFIQNMEKITQNEFTKYNFTIEFNPNKLKDNKIILFLLSVSNNWFLKSFDLAMDLPINILNLIYDKEYKRNVTTFLKEFDNKTIYIGLKASTVSYKIYNKKKESQLNILGELTRVEITNKFDDYSINKINNFKYLETNFPILYLNEYVYSFDDYQNKTLLVCLFAVLNGLDLNLLTDYYKKKVKEKLQNGGYKIIFDKKSATQVIKNCIYHYFPITKI